VIFLGGGDNGQSYITLKVGLKMLIDKILTMPVLQLLGFMGFYVFILALRGQFVII